PFRHLHPHIKANKWQSERRKGSLAFSCPCMSPSRGNWGEGFRSHSPLLTGNIHSIASARKASATLRWVAQESWFDLCGGLLVTRYSPLVTALNRCTRPLDRRLVSSPDPGRGRASGSTTSKIPSSSHWVPCPESHNADPPRWVCAAPTCGHRK